MIINETRKQIIELISPYMDKTLSEGCLINYDNIEIYKLICKGTGNYEGFYICSYLDLEKGVYSLDVKINISVCKIIGHYDITAVLKYIRERVISDLRFLNLIKNGEIIGHGTIQFKPLHLYTEEEDKQLLDLLLKLK